MNNLALELGLDGTDFIVAQSMNRIRDLILKP